MLPSGECDISLEPHFITLASKNTTIEEFVRLRTDHMAGYKPKKMLYDGLKKLQTKMDEIENKLSVMKAIGKAKQLSDEEQSDTNLYSGADLRDKAVSTLRAMETQIEEGPISLAEKSVILEHLGARLATAKQNDKPKVIEKLDRLLGLAHKAKGSRLPLSNIEEINGYHKELREIERLAKRQSKIWTTAERERMDEKPKILQKLAELEKRSRMWFEQEFSFTTRLKETLEIFAKEEEESRKKEEEQAWQTERDAEERAMEEKRLKEHQKKEEDARKLQEKLEAKRLEDAKKPQKAAPKKVEKKPKRVVKLDPNGLFLDPADVRRQKEEDEELARWQEEKDLAALAAEQEEEEKRMAVLAAPLKPKVAEEVLSPPISSAAPALEKPKVVEPTPPPVEVPKKARLPKVELENKWGASPECLKDDVNSDDPAGETEPSLLEAVVLEEVSAPKPVPKKAGPPPKKKEKAKFSKVLVRDLGFDANNPNYR